MYRKFLNGMVIGLIATASFLTAPVTTQAYSLEPLPESTVYGDFVVGPGKIEIELNPGETRTIELTIANRLGVDKSFLIHKEDFSGSKDLQKTVVLLGDDQGPYSLSRFIGYSTSTLEIPHGMKARVPVTITVPLDAQPGGLYGSVIVSTVSKGSEINGTGAKAANPIITQIGTLFFVLVKGDVKKEGMLTDFFANGRSIFITKTPIVFGLTYENTGNVHVDPYGTISVTNILGSTVGKISADAWFAMPDSIRFREVTWDPPFLFGKYTAKAEINRGYGNIVDTKEISFWIIPWKILLIAFVVIVALFAVLRFVFTRFRLVRTR